MKWESAKIETAPVRVILKAFKMISEQTSGNKLTSVQKIAWVKIGSIGRELLYHVPRHQYNYCTSTETANKFHRTKIESVKLARDNLTVQLNLPS